MRCGTWPNGTPRSCDDTIVMETGGMKGRREELPKEEFHRILCDAFGVDRVHSEYGMARTHVAGLLARAANIFRMPGLDAGRGTRRATIRSDRLPAGSRGAGVDIADLAYMVVVRLHPDPGRGARLGRRMRSAGRRAHRPQRHQGLQPAGAVAERQRHHTVPVRRLPHTGYDP